MSNSSRFAVAVHMLAVLALKSKPVSSAALARSIGTNPAFVRQILMRLNSAGLVKGRLGKTGGSFLGAPAEGLSLLAVFDAIEGSAALLSRHKSSPSPECVVGRHILDVLDVVTSPAETAFREGLATVSIADVLAQIAVLDPVGAAATDC